ncbi:hypothetical protein EHM69_10460 [candidate division KSB1 bacterium]|nr:MAG: hypothetical protein EHM69_10460 [candidate division KSB1 bacterium]
MYSAVTISVFALTIPEKSYGLILQIVLALGLLGYFVFRKKSKSNAENNEIRRIEIKLIEELTPSEIHVQFDQITDLIIHRYAQTPPEEYMGIEDLDIYEILPAGHTTIITINPQKRGTFPIILGGAKAAGTIIVE